MKDKVYFETKNRCTVQEISFRSTISIEYLQQIYTDEIHFNDFCRCICIIQISKRTLLKSLLIDESLIKNLTQLLEETVQKLNFKAFISCILQGLVV